jgi:hypothetical protein
MKMNYLTVTLALAMAMLAFAPKSSQAQVNNVILDGNTAIGIENLFVPTIGGAFNVAFTLTDANSLYGPNPDFTFPFDQPDTGEVMQAMIDALDNSSATSAGTSSTLNSTSVFIGYAVSEIQPLSIDADNGIYNEVSERWLNTSGVEFLFFDEERYFAVFTPAAAVPEPSSIMVTGCLLVGLGFRRRRRR